MRALVVAAHPDDDILGCGGYLARLAAEGARIRVLFLADGVGSRAQQPQTVDERRADARSALEVVGVTDPVFESLPDNALDTVPLRDVCALVEQEVADHRPALVLTHSASDLNVDHRITAEATLTACRPQPGSSVRRILGFEVPSSTGWRPTSAPFDPRYFADVTPFLERKLTALRAYESEMRPWPHARSFEAVEALARWRGASVGLAASEAFEVYRWIDGD